MRSAEIPFTASDGRVAVLVIAQLPGSPHAPGVRDGMVVVTEGRSYRYEIGSRADFVSIEPAELFGPDDLTLRSGRLTPGEAVGLVQVEARDADGTRFVGAFDSRTQKFSDEQAFDLMLSDLAAMAVEALHQGFAPAAGAFSAEPGAEPRLLYQQFAVLRSLLNGEELQWSIAEILHAPHRAWESIVELRLAGRALKGSSRLSAQLARPGSRVPVLGLRLTSLPSQLMVERTDETRDTVPNRFVRFVFERWRAIAQSVLDNTGSLSGAVRRRGAAEAARIVAELDDLLARPFFREVGLLTLFPHDNQVLLRTEGYRQVLAAAAVIEGSLGLSLDVEDPILVSRRSIATLYEYWTFAKLASALFEVCGRSGVEGRLFKASNNGMSLVLKANAASRLSLTTCVGGQDLAVDLLFNNEFRGDSWTRPMRPDASIVIRRPGDHEVWLHFDAKYRVDWSAPFETGEGAADEEAIERTGQSKPVDLLKMHAYRDAIRNSAGSYVLFPGSEAKAFQFSDEEFLPGLGAFPLRPDRADEDVSQIKRFLGEALGHIAGAGTRHRRARYWSARAYDEYGTVSPLASTPSELPPADTQVLVGYVRSVSHWRWIERNGLYNVRGGNRRGAVPDRSALLDAPLFLLHGADEFRLYQRASQWDAVSREGLLRLGYPDPGGETYLVAQVQTVDSPEWLAVVDLNRVRPAGRVPGAPFTCSWLDLVLATQDVH